MASRIICIVAMVNLIARGSYSQLNVCGKPALNTRIVGARKPQRELALAGQSAPHKGSRLWGSLINNQWVLSAAHCFTSDPDPSEWTVYVGRQTQTGSNPNEQFRTVAEIISHPSYDDDTNENDIALLKLSSSVEFTDHISPVCLAEEGSSFVAGTDSWVTGFGTLAEGGVPSNTLQEVEVPVVGNSQCSANYGNLSFHSFITDNMICAGLEEGGKDSCQGDCGSPMVHKQKSVWVQSGVVSFSLGCAQPNIPGVYARVSRYQDWITHQVTGDAPGFVRFTSASSSQSDATRPLFTLLLSLLPVLHSLYVLCSCAD